MKGNIFFDIADSSAALVALTNRSMGLLLSSKELFDESLSQVQDAKQTVRLYNLGTVISCLT